MQLQTRKQAHLVNSILTITLNPALDMSTAVEAVIAGPKLRCHEPSVEPGGGGINVSRAIQKLGGTSHALVAAGGANGERLVELLRQHISDVIVFKQSVETRQSFAVTDMQSRKQYRFVLPGPHWTRADVDAFWSVMDGEVKTDSWVVLSGSMPTGIPENFTATLNEHLSRKGARLFVDTSNAALTAVAHKAHEPYYLMRTDAEEAKMLAGKSFKDASDLANFAESLVERKIAEHVVMSIGDNETIAVSANDKFVCTPPEIPVISAVGAGDSMVGAMALKLSQGHSFRDAVTYGVAAAGAAVETPATQLCDLSRTEHFLPLVTVRSL